MDAGRTLPVFAGSKWLEHAWPHLKKAVDWIVEQRSATKKILANGEHAAGVPACSPLTAEDNTDWANWFAINAYAWAGVDRTAQALKDCTTLSETAWRAKQMSTSGTCARP